MPADVAHRDASFLGLGPHDLDVLLAALLGELGEHDADRLAVAGRVDAEVGVADRLLDGVQRTRIEWADQHHPRLRRLERRQLLQRGRGAVVLGLQLVEHRRVGAAGSHGREILPGEIDGSGHLLDCVLDDVVDHGWSFRKYVSDEAGVGRGRLRRAPTCRCVRRRRHVRYWTRHRARRRAYRDCCRGPG